MCLTALKNSLVLGNCQPIISTPSSGLSLALHLSLHLSLPPSLPLFHSVCVLISRHHSLYLIFSPNSPSKLTFSVTHMRSLSLSLSLSQIHPPPLYFFSFRPFHMLGHIPGATLFCPPPQKKKPLSRSAVPVFHSFFPIRILHPVKQRQMPPY